MRSKKIYEPQWLISDRLGIDVDAHNWCLCVRGYSIDKGYGRWDKVAYYPTPEAMFRGCVQWLTRRMEIVPTETELEHIERCYRTVSAFVREFDMELNRMRVAGMTPASGTEALGRINCVDPTLPSPE